MFPIFVVLGKFHAVRGLWSSNGASPLNNASNEAEVTIPIEMDGVENTSVLLQAVSKNFFSFVPHFVDDMSSIQFRYYATQSPDKIYWLSIFNTTFTARQQYGRFPIRYSTRIACTNVIFTKVKFRVYIFIDKTRSRVLDASPF